MYLTDQIGHTLHLLPQPPQRIVSLVPSQTELLHYLGLDQQVVGITRFCVHPPHWRRTKTRIGGTKDPHLNRIHALQPDLIIANKEENVQAHLIALQQHYPVYTSDIGSLTDAYAMIQHIGTLTHTAPQAQALVAQLRTQFSLIPKQNARIAYLIWQNPYMVAASNTFIHHLLCDICGFTNIFAAQTRYPITNLAQIAEAQPDVVLLSSEPYPFTQQHIASIAPQLPAHTRLLLVDGELLSWYGSRLLHTSQYLQNTLFHIIFNQT